MCSDGLGHGFVSLLRTRSLVQHCLAKVHRFLGARSNDFSSSLGVDSQPAGLIVAAGSPVKSVEGELDGHLEEGVGAELVPFDELLAEGDERQPTHIQVSNQARKDIDILLRESSEISFLKKDANFLTH